MLNERVLPRPTKRLYHALLSEPWIEDFYLAGGTAVALHYGHRQSVDLDFFSKKDFDTKVVKMAIRKFGEWEGLKEEECTLVGRVAGTKVSFFTIDEKLLKEPHQDQYIRIADPLDLALMKVTAISDRGTKRDFVDLYVLSKKYLPLVETMRYFDKKYGKKNYNLQHIVRSLGYFGDAEGDRMPRMLIPLTWKEVKEFFHAEAELVARNFLTS
jgi:hypothetical protein